MKKFKTLLALLLCMVLLTGCSTSMMEHTDTYFTQMAYVFDTAVNSSRLIAEAEANSATQPTIAENALAAPTNLTVDADGNYSFDAVENAASYIIFVYANETTKDATSKLQIMEDGSAKYTGNVADIQTTSGKGGTVTLGYGSWDIRVVAYPDFENSDYVASPEATYTYIKSGAVEHGSPEIAYMWSIFGNELTISVNGMDYSTTAYPTQIDLTLINDNDSSDVVELQITDVSGSSASVTTDQVKLDATYSVSAALKWDESYVTNASFSIDGVKAQTSSTVNLLSDNFYYSGNIFKELHFPHVQTGFDPINGGQVGIYQVNPYATLRVGAGSGSGNQGNVSSDDQTDTTRYFNATPNRADDGAKYSYNVMITSPAGGMNANGANFGGSETTTVIFAVLNLYDDGTLSMEIEYQYISSGWHTCYVPGAICYGSWTENSDGTVNLNYNHEEAKETIYEAVTELTGQAAEYLKEHPEFRSSNQGGMGGGGMGGGGMAGFEIEPENTTFDENAESFSFNIGTAELLHTTATRKDTPAEGAKYSYQLEKGDPNAPFNVEMTLDLMEDGTAVVNVSAAGPISAATVNGTWAIENGVITLSFE